MVITLGREFGSGGRELGRRLADKLQIAYYDKEILTEIAKRTQLTEEYVHNVVEHHPYPLLPITIGHSLYPDMTFQIQQSVYIEQSNIIKEMAAASDCVIVGRGADQILKDYPHCLRVYLYADLEHKTAFCKEHYGEDAQTAAAQMKRNDGSRAEYYRQYFGADIKDPRHYQICLNVGALGLERCCAIITEAFKALSTAAEAV